jgi:hypothetical protein
MRWPRKDKTPDELRAKCGFLIFPKTIGNETRWLEWAKWSQILRRVGPIGRDGKMISVERYYYEDLTWWD